MLLSGGAERKKPPCPPAGRFCFHRSAVPVRAALVHCRVGYFTYLSSQPQNSLVWNREFFGWLDKYVKEAR